MRPRRDRRAAAVAVLVALVSAAPGAAATTPARPTASTGAPVAPTRSSAATAGAHVRSHGGQGVAAVPRPHPHPPTAGAPPAPGAPPAAAAPPLGPDPDAQDASLGGPGPLVANGLGSPTCRQRTELSPIARANCGTSGVAEAAAPLDDYQLDVHIDTGVIGTSAESVIQDFVLRPIWLAVVWLTDFAVVALEWCFSLDLLATGALDPIARGLQSMRDALTVPWLAPVLAIAAVGVVYNGIVRRRIVDTVGQVALLMAMMSVGLWVIADPIGTVGAASQLVNEASLGVFGAAATGDPDHGLRSLDDGLRPLFAESVTGPWCYLEFGNVAWCREPSRLDPKLVAAARAVVVSDRAAATSPAQRRQVAVEAAMIDRARTNGDLFLALPANGPRRNSINADAGNPSLLNVLCGGSDASSCPADTGPEAVFRTKSATGARIGGLLLVVVGSAGMCALVGFICLRLLGAALLAPALGDGGRDAFRRWSLRLLGAVLAKLVYAVFLGVVLLMVRILSEIGGGWWTEWLLLSAFWWLVFNNRHRVLENVIHERAEPNHRASMANKLFATRQALKLTAPAAKTLGRAGRRAPEQLRKLPERVLKPARRRRRTRREEAMATQVGRTLERDHAAAAATVAHGTERELALADLRARRDQIQRAQREPGLASNRRRAASLQRRRRDVEADIASGEQELASARATVTTGAESRRQTGLVYDKAQGAARAALLDREAELRPRLARAKDRRHGRRDYETLASLVGPGAAAYRHMSEPERRRAQLAIDRELESRRKWKKAVSPPAGGGTRRRGEPASAGGVDPRPQRREVSSRQRQFDRHGSDPGNPAGFDSGLDRPGRTGRSDR
jgi:hypothetical protein